VYKAKVSPDLVPPSFLSGGTSGGQERTKVSRIREQISPLIKQSPEHIPSSHVAIKVLHPRVAPTIYRDIRIMRFFANIINAIPTMEWLSLPDEVDQFAEMMKLQLDLRIEGANLEIFQRNFTERSTVTFPTPFQEYTTRKVLIEEFAHGLPLPWFLDQGAGPYNKEMADMGLDAFLHMLLIDNFVHADLHPGNIMVRFYKSKTIDLRELIKILWSRPNGNNGSEKRPPRDDSVTEEAITRLRPHKNNPDLWTQELEKLDKEGFRPQLIFIDTGLVTQLNDTNRKNFLDLFRAVAEFDGYRAGHLMVQRCRQPDAVIDPEIFALKMQHLVLGVKSKTFALGQIKFGDVLHEVLTMVRNHHVRVEGDFVNVVISILLLEGIGRQLDPDMDLFKSAIPILREVGARGAREAISKGEAGDLRTSGAWLKVWVGLETRNLISASVQEVTSVLVHTNCRLNGWLNMMGLHRMFRLDGHTVLSTYWFNVEIYRATDC
jgi:aarF domain-containing kinase